MKHRVDSKQYKALKLQSPLPSDIHLLAVTSYKDTKTMSPTGDQVFNYSRLMDDASLKLPQNAKQESSWAGHPLCMCHTTATPCTLLGWIEPYHLEIRKNRYFLNMKLVVIISKDGTTMLFTPMLS